MRFLSLLRSSVVVVGLVFAGRVSHAQFAQGAPGTPNTNGPALNLNSLGPAPDREPAVHNRVIQGYVRDANGKTEPDAVVYLKNKATSTVQSVFPSKDGEYRIGNLTANVDYEVWAVANQKKGPARTVSQYDTRDQLVFNLKTE